MSSTNSEMLENTERNNAPDIIPENIAENDIEKENTGNTGNKDYDNDRLFELTEKTQPNSLHEDQDAEINEYCPKIFREIRLLDGVSNEVLSE